MMQTRNCWKAHCTNPQRGYVRAQWSEADFVSYETCAWHSMMGMKILLDTQVDHQIPLVVEWAMQPWPAEMLF